MKKFLSICAAALFLALAMACTKKNPVQSAVPTGSPQNTEMQTPGSVIIAESSNAVSDKEKQAVLDNLAKQIDDAFNAAKNLEDLDNSDLDPGKIQ